MRKQMGVLLASAFLLAHIALADDQHTIVTADNEKWAPAPPVLPPGAKVAVLYGDPAKDGLFVMRIKVPDGYRIAPHTHPAPEVVTVISGTIRLGMGETADDQKAQALPAGSFFALPPGMAHYAQFKGPTVVQISTNGPWAITYVNPKDDPRKSQ